MIVRTCPYRKDASSSITNLLGEKNIVAVHVAKEDFVAEHAAPFSIKYVLQGMETYACERRVLSVDTHKYAVINKGQPYSSWINTEKTTSSFCIFFSDRVISEGYGLVKKSCGYLLDNGLNDDCHELTMHQKLHWRDDTMNALLASFVPMFDTLTENDLRTDEWCLKIVDLLISKHICERQQWQGLKATKASTKRELHKRLSAAVDFIHENFNAAISLAQLSNVACLSSFHFVRSFQDTFHKTPHQYVTSVRLKHASRLLMQSNFAVKDICIMCGFSNESAFIRAFKAAMGLPPGLFRKKSSLRLKGD